jgi:(4-O-methyl)-D-glucuronate---lignin esterase
MLHRLRIASALTVCLCLFATSSILHAEERGALEDGFRSPPVQTKPAVYWYWISDNISKEGVTRDLEAMARVGIGEAFIGNIFLDNVPAGDVKVMTEEWWELIEHAVREAGRVGVNIGMFNCPGWSQSGGPWITPDRAMRYLSSSELRVRGPKRLEAKLEVPVEDFQDVTVLAFRAPKGDADSLAARKPQLGSAPEAVGLQAAVDGNLETEIAIPAGQFSLDIVLDEPLTARSITLVPTASPWSAQCELLAAGADGQFRPVKTFRYDRSNMEVHVGPLPEGPVVASFEPTTAKRFRLVFTQITGKASLREIDISSAARVEAYVEKQLGKMHPTPLPMWDTYLWPQQPEIDSRDLAVPSSGVLDLSSKMSDNGTLRWDVPEGDWVIQRIGMAPTGTENSPSSPEGIGLEVDKMNRDHARHHFDAFIGQLLKRMPANERKAFTTIVADSYEQGSQNWTEGFDELFQQQYGYDPIPWLATLSGRVVGSADQSNRFLWDLRRLVADRIATEYVGGLRDLCQPHGLQVWLENYGHWGFPAEFLQYGGQSHRIGGEFWTKGSLGSIECRAASSAANTYGFPVVSAEAFTSSPSRFDTVPSDLKARGDWAFCEGINHFVLHVYVLQPWEDRRPGANAWFGTEFNRHNTWFEEGRTWIDYLRRCCVMLQQGTRVADVAYFIGEDTPKMTGIRQPELPQGYDFDYINAEVLLRDATVKNGRLTLPHGASYRVLVLPEQETMRPELLQKIGELVRGGAVVLGKPPKRSPSMENYPQCDERVKQLAVEIWGGEERGGSSRRSVMATMDLTAVFERLGAVPDFVSEAPLRYTHRSTDDKDIYFVANPEPQEITTLAAFRVGDRAPSLWCPKSGQIERPAVYDCKDATVRIPMTLGPHASVFVVFGSEPASPERIVAVRKDSKTILDATQEVTPCPTATTSDGAAGSFTVAMWVRPSVDTTIVPQHTSGVHGMAESRNEATVATHGAHLGGDGHAGCGIAVGQNGVCVFEHGANYFSPTLSHAAAIRNWTHVAVVYENNCPSLFLNGRLAHTGLQSTHTVHPGTPSGSFAGELGAIEQVGRALDTEEVADLMKSMGRPDELLPSRAVQLVTGTNGEIETLFWKSGEYTFTTAQGRSSSFGISDIPSPMEVAGPWEVDFRSPLGASKKTSFDTLLDWTIHSDDAIRHFAGKATYRKTFQLPESMAGKPLRLDLGKLHDVATVRLNGRELATLWMAPWQVDITDVAKVGENVLEVEVVNTWYNRLAGDANLPAGERTTYLHAPSAVPVNATLKPAGLIGPVTIRAGVRGR